MNQLNTFLSHTEYLFYGMIILAVLILVLIVLLAVQISKTSKLKKRLDKFVLGKDGASLEQDIAGLYEDNKFLKTSADKNKKDIRTLYKRMENAYQKMGIVKYDAFNQMGGQLSFSLALLMKTITDLLSILYIAQRDVILIQKRLKMEKAPFLWEKRKRKRWRLPSESNSNKGSKVIHYEAEKIK